MKLYPIGESKLYTHPISGNVIPLSWYRHITRPNGKPYSIAIELLADLVWWYRPVEERDELSGELIGYKKKFKADLLQRSYGAFSKVYGYTKDQVRDALERLQEIGLIYRDFRTIDLGGGRQANNVLYIGIYPQAIKKITYTLSDLNPIASPERIREPIGKESDTNTDNHLTRLKDNKDFGKVVSKWESATGQLTPMIAEGLGERYDLIALHLDHLAKNQGVQVKISAGDWLIASIEVMVKHAERFSLAYIDAVNKNWIKDGFRAKRTKSKGKAIDKKSLAEAMTAEEIAKARSR